MPPRTVTRRRARIAPLAAASGVTALLALSGCGQKGPLYLPDAGGEVVTRPTQSPPEAAPAPDAGTTPRTPPATDPQGASTPTPPPTRR